jgi:pentatricopeptide repeat protein
MGLDSVTISIVLLMYAYLAALQHAKEIHGYNIRSALGFNSFVETSLIYMFAECGCIENACLVFDRISQGDIATWNAMIAGYDMHGHGGDSIALIDKMKEVGFIPNHITFTALLSACNHAGIIDEGWKSFDCII